MAKKPIPYDFVIEELSILPIRTKAMFGCEAIYLGEKILFILRQKEDYPRDNGVWFAIEPENHPAMKSMFPSLRDIGLFGGGPTSWQNLPEESDEFESDLYRACDLVRRGDTRFGKVPKSKAPRRAGSKKKKVKTTKTRNSRRT